MLICICLQEKMNIDKYVHFYLFYLPSLIRVLKQLMPNELKGVSELDYQIPGTTVQLIQLTEARITSHKRNDVLLSESQN